MIKLTIIKTNPDWLEATWINLDGEYSDVIHCESFSGHSGHIEMLKNRCIDFGTKLSKEDEKLIKEIQDAFVYPSNEEIEAEKETQRVLLIKSKAKELIYEKYTDIQQRNILMSRVSVDIVEMNDYILNIRKISNLAEQEKTDLEDIDWNINLL